MTRWLHRTAALALVIAAGTLQAAPIGPAPHGPTLLLEVRNGARPHVEPPRVEPPRVERPERPLGFDDTRPGTDGGLVGGRVKTAEELRRELEKNMDDCAGLAESAQREQCEQRARRQYMQDIQRIRQQR